MNIQGKLNNMVLWLAITAPEHLCIVHEPYSQDWHFQSMREWPVEVNLYPQDLYFPWMWCWPVEVNEVNLNKCYNRRGRIGRRWRHWGYWKGRWRDHWGSVPSRSSGRIGKSMITSGTHIYSSRSHCCWNWGVIIIQTTHHILWWCISIVCDGNNWYGPPATANDRKGD